MNSGPLTFPWALEDPLFFFQADCRSLVSYSATETLFSTSESNVLVVAGFGAESARKLSDSGRIRAGIGPRTPRIRAGLGPDSAP